MLYQLSHVRVATFPVPRGGARKDSSRAGGGKPNLSGLSARRVEPVGDRPGSP